MNPLSVDRLYITHLTDILVSDTADLLDIGGALGDTLEGVTGKDELILNVGGGSNIDVGLGSHATNVLLTEEVTIEKLANKLIANYSLFFLANDKDQNHTGSQRRHGQSPGWAQC